jgi:hypothetical protein
MCWARGNPDQPLEVEAMSRYRQLRAFALACILVLPAILVTTGSAAGACADTWTSNQTRTNSANVGQGKYTMSVTYKLQFNTCNLGVYTKIKVVSYTNTFKITNAVGQINYIDFEAAVLKNCSGLTSGCLLYPGPQAYYDGRHYNHGPGNGTYTRTASPNVTFAYDVHAATWDYWTTSSDPWKQWFVYQFLRDALYVG